MELSKKVKTAVDETRILILGAQILLGFQFRGVFSKGYEQLASHAGYMDWVALGLIRRPCPCRRISRMITSVSGADAC